MNVWQTLYGSELLASAWIVDGLRSRTFLQSKSWKD